MLINKVKQRLDELKVPYTAVGYSPLKNKKITIVINEKIIHFGQKGSRTYLEGATDIQRAAYRARAGASINKSGKYNYKILYSPSWLSYNILW